MVQSWTSGWASSKTSNLWRFFCFFFGGIARITEYKVAQVPSSAPEGGALHKSLLSRRIRPQYVLSRSVNTYYLVVILN